MPDSTPGTTSKPQPVRPRRRILLVDDNAEGRRALARLLEFYNFDVTTAADGTSALKAMHESPPPDVVLTDLLLPDIDGREVARQANTISPKPTVVMITGWDFGSEVPDKAGWGVDYVFLKPLNVSELVAQLAAPETGR